MAVKKSPSSSRNTPQKPVTSGRKTGKPARAPAKPTGVNPTQGQKTAAAKTAATKTAATKTAATKAAATKTAATKTAATKAAATKTAATKAAATRKSGAAEEAPPKSATTTSSSMTARSPTVAERKLQRFPTAPSSGATPAPAAIATTTTSPSPLVTAPAVPALPVAVTDGPLTSTGAKKRSPRQASATATSSTPPALSKLASTEPPGGDTPAAQATAYLATFAPHAHWAGVVVGPTVYSGPATGPLLAEAGKPLVVRYRRRPAGAPVDAPLAAIEVGFRLGTGPVGARALVNEQATLLLPSTAQGVLQLWFRLEGTDGRVWWDSDGGRNHHVEVMPGAEVFLHFEGVAAGPR